MYIAQGKPNKAHTTILEKDPTKRVANEVLVQRTMMRHKVLMYDIDVQGSHEQECGDDMCSWMAYERFMDDVHKKEKAHRQGGVSRTYSWSKKNSLT